MTLRQLPPAAAPISARDLYHGAAGLLSSVAALSHLREGFQQALGLRHVFLVSSGRAALALVLRALRRLSARRTVIVPAYTCYTVPAAIVRAGLEVVPCDLEPGTFDFDYAQLEALMSGVEPLCVVPTHLFGFPADVARTRALARAFGTFVVEDAAQSFGGSTAEGPLGALGDAGFYSFGRGKNITCGEGGAVVTGSAPVAAALAEEYVAVEAPSLFRSFASLLEIAALAVLVRPTLYWLPASLPFLGLGETRYDTAFSIQRLDGARAGLLRNWRQRLPRLDRARAGHAAALMPLVPSTAGAERIACVRLPIVCKSRAERDRLYAAGRRERLGFSMMYPGAITAIPELRRMLGGAHCPVAEDLAERLLTIPVHPLVSMADRAAIARLLEPEPQLA